MLARIDACRVEQNIRRTERPGGLGRDLFRGIRVRQIRHNDAGIASGGADRLGPGAELGFAAGDTYNRGAGLGEGGGKKPAYTAACPGHACNPPFQ